jgi:hypothetical protein
MSKQLSVVVLVLALATWASAQLVRTAPDAVPNGKGQGVYLPVAPPTVHTGNGINYHNGPVMGGTPNIYLIWYGNWVNGPHGSDSQTTVNLVNSFLGGLSGSGYEMINSTYGDNSKNVTGTLTNSSSTTVGYTYGTRLSDTRIKNIVTNAISNGSLPKDTNGLYFVLTSSDVTETSGFCSQYCGWHTHASILSADIKYSFVGNPDRCSNACEAQTNSPNGDSGADGMVSIIAHESEEAISDPDLNAWYDGSGAENADKCAWKWGTLLGGSVGNKGYNQTFGGHNWLIQMNWENARGGGCDDFLGGPFHNN